MSGKIAGYGLGWGIRWAICCGLSVEYGRYNLGVVRDESVWRYSITLKNIITAGNLNRAVSLF
jgi:LPS-assembly protein